MEYLTVALKKNNTSWIIKHLDNKDEYYKEVSVERPYGKDTKIFQVSKAQFDKELKENSKAKRYGIADRVFFN